MPFKDFMEFAEPLALPVGGKVYTLPLVGINDANQLVRGGLAGLTGSELERVLLGDVAAVLKEDNVPSLAMTRMMLTALVEVQAGRGAAEAFWESGQVPAALAATSHAPAAAVPSDEGDPQ